VIVTILWDPDPDMGFHADGTPRARTAILDTNVLVVWVDEFGTPQYTAAGIFDTPEVDAIVATLPIGRDP